MFTDLGCATFHILTPHPNTPLFRKLEVEGRLLRRNWESYDPAHAVLRPRLTSSAWHPLVEWTRRRHVRFRRRLAEMDLPVLRQIEPGVFPPGV